MSACRIHARIMDNASHLRLASGLVIAHRASREPNVTSLSRNAKLIRVIITEFASKWALARLCVFANEVD